MYKFWIAKTLLNWNFRHIFYFAHALGRFVSTNFVKEISSVTLCVTYMCNTIYDSAYKTITKVRIWLKIYTIFCLFIHFLLYSLSIRGSAKNYKFSYPLTFVRFQVHENLCENQIRKCLYDLPENKIALGFIISILNCKEQLNFKK